jgi:hypothetical protein
VVDPRAWHHDRHGTCRRLSVADVGLDWPHARLGTVIALYLVFPLLLLVGPIWLFGWIAAFVAPTQPTREADL